MNIKLDTVLSEMIGVSCINIIRAIVAGERDPKELTSMRHNSCKKTEEDICCGTHGKFSGNSFISLQLTLETYDQPANKSTHVIIES